MDAKKPHPNVLTIFGAGGDLTWRKLVPALFDLCTDGYLPEHFAVIGVDIKEMDDESFRAHLLEGIKKFSRHPKRIDSGWPEFSKRIHYLAGDFSKDTTYAAIRSLIEQEEKSWSVEADHIFYLAVAPRFIDPVTLQLAAARLLTDEDRSRVVVEKPFGHDLASAVALNRSLLKICPENQIYRIDHYLGKETIQNILAFRFANAMFEPIWDRRYIDHVQITVAESVGVGHRGGYYDQSGALRDMVQNHLMQILCLIAMEPPVSFGADEIRSRKVDVLRAIRPVDPSRVSEVAVRGQYRGGFVQSEQAKAYRDEEGVKEGSATETYAALKLYVDNWRWKGVPFYLRSGKRLPERVSQATIRFRPVPHQAFPSEASAHWESNEVQIMLQPEEGICVRLQAKKPGASMKLGTVNMSFNYREAFRHPSPEAYETLLLDVMEGDATLFMRSDQVEKAWEIVMPIIRDWESHDDIQRYDAGAWGPDKANELIAKDGRSWIRPEGFDPDR